MIQQSTSTATFLRQSGTARFGIGTLIDNDLLRDRDFDEAVDLGFGQWPQGGSIQGFDADSQEVSACLTFFDGTTPSDVDALQTSFTAPGGSSDVGHYLFDTAALAAVGMTITDVARVNSFSNTDHDLNWTSFGFSGTPSAPQAPPPPSAPVLNEITGTVGADRLVGTTGADLIWGGDRSERLTGRAGADIFVFDADVRDGNRDRDVITDFRSGEDTIVSELGTRLQLIKQRCADLFIQLGGRRSRNAFEC